MNDTTITKASLPTLQPDATDVAAGETAMNAREWLWLGITSVGLIAVYLSPLREHLKHAQQIKADLAAFGYMAPLMYIVMLTILTAIGLPRMLFYPIGGLAFGFSWGIAYNMTGTIFGAFLTFQYARWAGRSLVIKKWPRLVKIVDVFEGHGVFSVALLRQIPSPGFLTNLFFGISPVTHFAFIGGTLLGCIPSAIPATLIGSSMVQTAKHSQLWYVGLSVVSLFAIWLVFGIVFKHSPRFAAMRTAIKSNLK